MSDTETSDLMGLSAPLTKLVETAAVGLGKLYEPTHIRRMAKAKADEINLIGEAIRQNPELPIKYEDGKLILDGTDFTELAQRAQQRFALQELKKQQNIDNIVKNAAQNLNETDSVDTKPVDVDWISHFFDAAAHVSNEEMQQLWGRILAGEITTSGSFSLRTLECLKTFSQKDAELFLRASSLFLHGGNIAFITNEKEIYVKYNIDYGDILQLATCGMINMIPMQNVSTMIQKNGQVIIRNNKDYLTIRNCGLVEANIQIDCYLLTTSAKELSSLILSPPNHNYLKDIEANIKSNLNAGAQVSFNYQFHQYS